jgi:hypothetical protein
MQIEIPVTAFVKKIIFAERNIPLTDRTRYTIISINEDDELFDLIRFKGRLTMYHKAIKIPTETLSIEISTQHAKELGDDAFAIGVMLDRYYKRMLCRAVEFRSLSSTHKFRAISEFLDSYDIEEDEYSREAAVKRVQRFFTKKSHKNTSFLVTKQEADVGILSPKKHYSQGQLQAIYENFKNSYPSYFFTKKGSPRIDLPQQVQVWIYRHIGGWHPNDIAQKFQITRKTVYANLAAFDREFEYRPKPTPLISATLSL